jgi:prolyl oligopeptidase PreP (S9A serine peptidase family)
MKFIHVKYKKNYKWIKIISSRIKYIQNIKKKTLNFKRLNKQNKIKIYWERILTENIKIRESEWYSLGDAIALKKKKLF